MLLSIGPVGTNFSDISVKNRSFPYKKMRLKMSSAKWRPFCPGEDVLSGQPCTPENHTHFISLFGIVMAYKGTIPWDRQQWLAWSNTQDLHSSAFTMFIISMISGWNAIYLHCSRNLNMQNCDHTANNIYSMILVLSKPSLFSVFNQGLGNRHSFI